MKTPLKSGAKYMTELCDPSSERQGVGINRWLDAVKKYCQYQQDPVVRRQNGALLAEARLKELYEEIDKVLPSLEYCLAPRKIKEKKGAGNLRSSGVEGNFPLAPQKPETELDKHAKVLYEWLDPGTPSRIRMLMHWQAAAGLPFVASVYHRSAQCFRVCGNSSMESATTTYVTLEQFQQGIKARHAAGSRGTEAEEVSASQASSDWAPFGA